METRHWTEEEIEIEYQRLCNTPSDINEHLSTLREYADECETVCEFGVRSCVSTFAFLASKCKKLVSYDIFDVAVPSAGKFTFICADDLTVEIEEVDFLFIDSFHVYKQLKAELSLHGMKAKKYIGFHDTSVTTFGNNSEDGTKPGLLQAITEFLDEHPEWEHHYHTEKNNGCTIIKRIL